MKKIKLAIFKRIHRFLGRSSFSQAGEDAVLDFLWFSIGNTRPTYLELGVCEPRNGNNTYRFYLRGARGVLVEADASLIAKIKWERPGDKVLNFGVNIDAAETADFFIFDEPSINTFNKEEADFREKQGKHKIVKVVSVKLKEINELIGENFNGGFPDLLSIDIEGLDFQVLNSLDVLKYPIPVIIAETCEYSENHIKVKNKSIEQLMTGRGYFVFADTYINTIFVHTEWFMRQQKP
jgi:hypothetical protein